MASAVVANQTREARALAQTLFGHCRELPEPYRSLAAELRRLRNVLEELEDALAEETLDEARRIRPLPAVSHATHTLAELDLAIPSFRSTTPRQDDNGTVATFKSNLDSARDDLMAAYDALTDSASGTAKLDFGRQSLDSVGALSSRASGQGRGRQSQASSVWSAAVTQEVRSQGSRTDLSSVNTPVDAQAAGSDEKEVSRQRHDSGHLPTLQIPEAAHGESNAPRHRSRSSPNLFSPFLYPDPMAVDFESALAMITGPEDDVGVGSPAASDANERRPLGDVATFASGDSNLTLKQTEVPKLGGNSNDEVPLTQSTTSEHLQVLPEGRESQDESISPLTRILSRASSMRRHKDLPKASSVIPGEGNHLETQQLLTLAGNSAAEPRLSGQTEGNVPPADTTLSTGAGLPTNSEASNDSTSHGGDVENDTPVLTRRGSRRRSHPNPGLDSPSSSQTLSLSSPRSASISNIPKVEVPQQESESTSLGNVEEGTCSIVVLSPGTDNVLPSIFVDDAGGAIEGISPTDDHLSVTAPRESRSLPEGSLINAPRRELFSVPMPRRKPPPPPPSMFQSLQKQSRSRPRYKITNPDVSSRPSSAGQLEDEDEDGNLYTTSRPSSPAVAVEPPHIAISTDDSQSVSDGLAAESASIIDIEGHDMPSVGVGPQRTKRSSIIQKVKSRRDQLSLPFRVPRSRSGGALHRLVVPFSSQPIDSGAHSRSRSFDFDSRSSTAEIPEYTNEGNSQGTTMNYQTPRPRSIVEPELVPMVQPVSTTGLEFLHTAGLDSDRARERSNSWTESQANQDATSRTIPAEFYGVYGPNAYATTDEDFSIVDCARADEISDWWNQMKWSNAEEYLAAHLESMIEQDNVSGIRRCRHLLGVLASFQGEWQKAFAHFISVLRTPINDITQLDAGDCAAAYWLGDLYALHNRREEAIFAYSIASLSPWFHGPDRVYFLECLAAECSAMQIGQEQSQLMHWVQSSENDGYVGDSIINTKIVSKNAAQIILTKQQHMHWGASLDVLRWRERQCRSSILFQLRERLGVDKRGLLHTWRLSPDDLHASSDWPLRYDPTFILRNVHQGRLLAFECDLIQVFESNSDAKIPKTRPHLNKNFTHSDLTWLIMTTRDCLRHHGIEWSEVANVLGTWFCCRYTVHSDGMANVQYFAVSIFKQSVRSGYGIEICPDGINMARRVKPEHTSTDAEHEQGVKHWRKVIQAYMEAAAKNTAHRSSGGQNTDSAVDADGDRPTLLARLTSRTTSQSWPAPPSPYRPVESLPPPLPPRPVGYEGVRLDSGSGQKSDGR